jgi:stearoyl-CoA desaturase (delta-9 desaturase)
VQTLGGLKHFPCNPKEDFLNSLVRIDTGNAVPYNQVTTNWVAMRVAILAIVILPFVGFIAAIVSLWGWGIGWPEVSMLIAMYVLTVLGITIGFHRLFTHRSFETNPMIQGILAILGSMAVEGPLLKWVALHRRHHQFSDKENDPHSPHVNFSGIIGLLRGVWYSHIGWFFTPDPPRLEHYVKDLHRSKLLRVIDRFFLLWVFLGLLIPALAGGLITHSWMGALTGLIWGGLARVFLVHHVTWSINSICHIWGSKAYETNDESKNNLLLGILGLGEGWHNNHHAFPSSARHGLKWWQIDPSYLVIQLFGILGLASKIKIPALQKSQI